MIDVGKGAIVMDATVNPDHRNAIGPLPLLSSWTVFCLDCPCGRGDIIRSDMMDMLPPPNTHQYHTNIYLISDNAINYTTSRFHRPRICDFCQALWITMDPSRFGWKWLKLSPSDYEVK